jgi:hypothetical protein
MPLIDLAYSHKYIINLIFFFLNSRPVEFLRNSLRFVVCSYHVQSMTAHDVIRLVVLAGWKPARFCHLSNLKSSPIIKANLVNLLSDTSSKCHDCK